MNFGEAIENIKKGKLLRRAGWNGKGMHIYLEDMYRYPINSDIYARTERIYEPVICMYTAQGTHQPGWLASQPDILAEDWELVE